MPTIGCDFFTKLFTFDDAKIKLQIWDTAGQERFRWVTRMYYRFAGAALVVFDVWNQQSFEKVEEWINQLEFHWEPNVVLVLIGNKIDKKKEREVKYEEAKELANEYGMEYFESSAKDGDGVEEVFRYTAKSLYERFYIQKINNFTFLIELMRSCVSVLFLLLKIPIVLLFITFCII